MSDPRGSIQASLRLASNYNAWIARQARAVVGQRLLDAGCGAGNISSYFADRELLVAVDEWPEFVELVQQRWGARDNVLVRRFDLADEGMVAALGGLGLDSAMCVNVLEHVEDDGRALANMARVLRPGAPIFLLVPAFPLLYGEHDRADHHFRRYTKRSLAAKLHELPLHAEEMRYMNLPGFFAWLVVGRILRQQLREGQIGAYDRIIPMIERVERRWAPPFGQSLVATLRVMG